MLLRTPIQISKTHTNNNKKKENKTSRPIKIAHKRTNLTLISRKYSNYFNMSSQRPNVACRPRRLSSPQHKVSQCILFLWYSIQLFYYFLLFSLVVFCPWFFFFIYIFIYLFIFLVEESISHELLQFIQSIYFFLPLDEFSPCFCCCCRSLSLFFFFFLLLFSLSHSTLTRFLLSLVSNLHFFYLSFFRRFIFVSYFSPIHKKGRAGKSQKKNKERRER